MTDEIPRTFHWTRVSLREGKAQRLATVTLGDGEVEFLEIRDWVEVPDADGKYKSRPSSGIFLNFEDLDDFMEALEKVRARRKRLSRGAA